jgi:hypothetical protein
VTQAAASRPAIEDPAIFAKPSGPGCVIVGSVIMYLMVGATRSGEGRNAPQTASVVTRRRISCLTVAMTREEP